LTHGCGDIAFQLFPRLNVIAGFRQAKDGNDDHHFAGGCAAAGDRYHATMAL